MLGNRSFTKKFAVGIVCLLGDACSGTPSSTCSTNSLAGSGSDPCATGGSSVGGASAAAGATATGGNSVTGGSNATGGATATTTGGTSAGGASAVVGAVTVDAGSYHTCATLSNGSVRCWGYNGYGALGDGTLSNRLSPVAVTNLTGAQSVTAGGWSSCALLSNGTVSCWGRNDKGQLGDGTTTNHSTFVATSSLSEATNVSSGDSHGCAVVTTDHAVRCWGDNTSYKLGTGTTADSKVPNSVLLLGMEAGATSVSVGEKHTCAVLLDKTVQCWGVGTYGQLGTFQPATNVNVPNVTGATAVAAGSMHSCALLEDHTVRCWGTGVLGQLGNGKLGLGTPAPVVGISNAVAITAGGAHTCALLDDGTARCWGNNGSGQLGDGTQVNQSSPVAVAGLSQVVGLSAGYSHTCAVLAEGTVKCWGSNVQGQLGDGTTTSRSTPQAVSGIPLSNGTSGTGGASGTGGTSSAGGKSATGGASSSTGGTGDNTGVSCSSCSSSLAICAADVPCIGCVDSESNGCAENANYQAVLSCLCGTAQRCDAVSSCPVPPPPPRLVAPVSANRQGPRPTLRVSMNPGADGTRVRLCRDRACASLVLELIGTTSLQASEALPPGSYFWNAVGRRQLQNGQWVEGTTRSATWEFNVGHASSSPLMGFGSLPDFDGDGRGDVAATNDFDDDNVMNPNAVTVFRVKSTSLASGEKYYGPESPISSSTVYFPYTFRNVGDVDGDGFVDAVTLANSSLTAPRIAYYRGSASGLKSPLFLQLSTNVNDHVNSMQWMGDVDGDGYADVAALFANSQRPSTSPYQLLLMRGSATGLLMPEAPISLDGLNYIAVRGLGDVNGDGFADVAVNTTATGAIRAFVFLGGAQGLPSTPSYTFPEVQKVTPLGDVDGDGYADTLMEVTRPNPYSGYSPSLTGYVVRGSNSLALDPLSTINYPQYFPNAGHYCSTGAGTCDTLGTFEPVGDVNGDGYADALVAGTVDPLPTRRVYLYLGSASGLGVDPVREFINPETPFIIYDTYYGETITGLGDINGDTFDDLGIVSGFIRKDSALSGTFPGLTPRLRIHTGSSAGPTLDPYYTISSNQNLNYNDDFGTNVCGIDG